MKKSFLLSLIFFMTIALLYWTGRCEAEDGVENVRDRNKIIELEIKGNKRVDRAFILSYINSKIGRQFSPNVLNDDVKRLYKTGYFKNVKVDFSYEGEGVDVIIEVKEKPVLGNVVIEGNLIFSKKYIKKILGFLEKEKKDIEGFLNKPINRAKLRERINKLKALYKQKGYYLAEIREKIEIDEETNKVIVYILINEGNKIRVRSISIEGNKEFSDKRILKLMKTKRKNWFNSGVFKKDVLKKDLERIKEFYQEAGYNDIEVDFAISYDEKVKNMFIAIDIKEGSKYITGKIIIKGSELFLKTEIKKGLELLPGTVFSNKKLRKDMHNIEMFYSNKGYISCVVSPQTFLNKKTGRIDILYQIEKGELFYVNRIDIRGNVVTKDVVIRRELKIFPNDKFDGQKLRQSYQNLRNLDYFEQINYDFKDTVVSNKKDLIIEVQEKKTGEFSFGGGYSSIDRGVGFVEIAQRNFDIKNFPTFSGGGQDLRLKAEIGRAKENYLLSFTEPWFAGRPLSLGFDLYNRTYEREDYDEGKMGGNIRLAKSFSDIWRWNATYCLEEIEISDISGNSLKIEDITKEEGKNAISSLAASVIRDTRDNRIDAHKGQVFINSVKFAGVGGDKKFTKYISEISQYISPGEESRFVDLVLELKLRAGIVNDWDNKGVPIYERFYAGGEGTIRGYEYRKVGPRIYGEPIGGKSMLIGNIELTFPLVKKVIKGAVFYDIGNVWAKSNDFNLSYLKKGAGVGIRLNTPIGPLKLDYGYGFDPDPGEKKQGHFYFSMSRGF